MKADLELVKMVLQRNELSIRKTAEIMEELQNELNADQDEQKPPPVKKQFVILVSDTEGVLDGKDLTGWVIQIPEEDSPSIAEERLIQSVYDYNVTPKGSRLPVKSIGEACEVVPPRITKEHSVWIKSKEPLLVVRTNNEIPSDGGVQ